MTAKFRQKYQERTSKNPAKPYWGKFHLKEEMLSSIWARTRPGLIGLLNGLQGIHVFVSNINGQKAQVTIKELGNDVKLYVDQYGHMWHLLAKGKSV